MPVFEDNKIVIPVITCIKKSKSLDIKDYNINYQIVIKIIIYISNPSKINKCWNCSYEINGEVYSYPIDYNNGIFHTTGNFCCYECAARYIYETYSNNEF